MMLNQMTLGEIAEEIMALNLEIRILQAKERKALKESSERATLAFQMAVTSDRMKLELILAGALISPPKAEAG